MLKIIGIIGRGLVYTQPLYSGLVPRPHLLGSILLCVQHFLSLIPKGLVASLFISSLSDQKQEINFVWPSLFRAQTIFPSVVQAAAKHILGRPKRHIRDPKRN